MKILKFIFGLGFFIAAVGASWANVLKYSEERVLLHTNYGDMVFVLFPEVAPKHVEQILKMVRLGVYDGFNFYRVERGFVAQISNQSSRLTRLTKEQEDSIHRIKGEFSGLLHERGTLSMARFEDPDSAEVSFSVLLGNARHLDGKYTIFGKLVDGFDTLTAIEKTPTDAHNQPMERITVNSASLLTPVELSKTVLNHPAPNLLKDREAVQSKIAYVRNLPAILVLAIILLFALGIFFLGEKFQREKKALASLIVLVGALGIFVLAEPVPPETEWLGGALFLGAILVFKFLGRFEAPDD